MAAGVVVGLVLYFIATNPQQRSALRPEIMSGGDSNNCCADTTAAMPTTATTTASPGCSTTPPVSWEISTCWASSPRGSRSTKSSTKRKNELEENKIICPFLSDVKKKDKNCKIFSLFCHSGQLLVGAGVTESSMAEENRDFSLEKQSETGEEFLGEMKPLAGTA